MILEWFPPKEFYKLPVSVEKKSWRFPYFCKSYRQRKIGTFLWVTLYLFILVLEIAFIFIKENKNIKGINIFDNIFLYSAYADHTTFFLSDKDSVIEVINAFHKFSLISGLKPNEAKCEIAGIGVLKGVSLALCGMDCNDLTNESWKKKRWKF